MSSASLILTDRSLALSEPKAVGAQGSTKVLAASSLGSCLVFVSSTVVTVALAARRASIGQARAGPNRRALSIRSAAMRARPSRLSLLAVFVLDTNDDPLTTPIK